MGLCRLRQKRVDPGARNRVGLKRIGKVVFDVYSAARRVDEVCGRLHLPEEIVLQAVLLGLSATISHTAIVGVIALAGLDFGQELSGERSEAYLQLASVMIIIGIAAWMAWRTWREQNAEHDYHHHGEPQSFSLAGQSLSLEIFEDGVPPRWRLRSETGAIPPAGDIRVTTVRADGAERTFALAARDGYLESYEEIPKPYAFKARVALAGDTAEVLFEEHNHDHMDLGDEDDAHARAHAADIRKRFAGRTARPRRSCCLV